MALCTFFIEDNFLVFFVFNTSFDHIPPPTEGVYQKIRYANAAASI
jgi:hypothetical protein